MTAPTELEESLEKRGPWWRAVTGYEWLVLVVACAGWIFDIYENQLFAVAHGKMLSDLLHVATTAPEIKRYSDLINGLFLAGGAFGGVLFGMIADRFGRSRSMILSILVYAGFSGLTALAQTVWQVAILRFLVATGTGGEWAVAAALVAEVFPKNARAHASGIFHASSILGGFAAGVASLAAGDHWRYTFSFGVIPALLVFAVRFYIREPKHKTDEEAGEIETGPAQPQPEPQPKRGFSEFWSNREYRRRAFLGLLLAGVGLIGYWGVYVGGQDLAREFLVHRDVPAKVAEASAVRAYSTWQLAGGGLGLFLMGPLCAWIGRRRAFVLMQIGALIAAPIVCFAPTSWAMLLALLALMGFFVNGMHAGYAVWFPELFPSRLRATGAGICFNGARLLAAPALALSGLLKGKINLGGAITVLSLVYLVGIVVATLLPETKGTALEE